MGLGVRVVLLVRVQGLGFRGSGFGFVFRGLGFRVLFFVCSRVESRVFLLCCFFVFRLLRYVCFLFGILRLVYRLWFEGVLGPWCFGRRHWGLTWGGVATDDFMRYLCLGLRHQA